MIIISRTITIIILIMMVMEIVIVIMIIVTVNHCRTPTTGPRRATCCAPRRRWKSFWPSRNERLENGRQPDIFWRPRPRDLCGPRVSVWQKPICTNPMSVFM